jgi:hypothetical protein
MENQFELKKGKGGQGAFISLSATSDSTCRSRTRKKI